MMTARSTRFVLVVMDNLICYLYLKSTSESLVKFFMRKPKFIFRGGCIKTEQSSFNHCSCMMMMYDCVEVTNNVIIYTSR